MMDCVRACVIISVALTSYSAIGCPPKGGLVLLLVVYDGLYKSMRYYKRSSNELLRYWLPA